MPLLAHVSSLLKVGYGGHLEWEFEAFKFILAASSSSGLRCYHWLLLFHVVEGRQAAKKAKSKKQASLEKQS